jgi:CBS domain-containing protein
VRNPKNTLARDLMNVELVTLDENTPIQEAMVTLEEYHITGAPVVNAEGQCVGVFSVADVLKRRREIDEGETPRAGDFFSVDPLTQDLDGSTTRDDYDEAMLGADTVGQWMTTDVKSVGPETTVEEVCRRMVKEWVHRVLVVDAMHLRGIITSFDIVCLVAGGDGQRHPPRRARKPAPRRLRSR